MRPAEDLACDPEVRLVDALQAGRMLSLSRTSIYSLVAAGELHPIRLGRASRFRVTEIDDLVRRAADGNLISLGRTSRPCATGTGA